MLWVNAIIQGVLLGGLYALFAAGLSLIFGVMGLVNVAHGDLIVLIAYMAYFAGELMGLGPFMSLLIVLPVSAWVPAIHRHQELVWPAMLWAFSWGFTPSWLYQGLERMGFVAACDTVARFLALAGILEPSEGEARIEGRPLSSVVGLVGVAFQHARLQLLRPTVSAEVAAASGAYC